MDSFARCVERTGNLARNPEPIGRHAHRDNTPLPVQHRRTPIELSGWPHPHSGLRLSDLRSSPQYGIAIPCRVTLLAVVVALDAATSSLRTSVGQFEDKPNGIGQPFPVRCTRLKMHPTVSSQAIEFSLTPSLRLAPIGHQQLTLFQPMQGRV